MGCVGGNTKKPVPRSERNTNSIRTIYPIYRSNSYDLKLPEEKDIENLNNDKKEIEVLDQKDLKVSEQEQEQKASEIPDQNDLKVSEQEQEQKASEVPDQNDLKVPNNDKIDTKEDLLLILHFMVEFS